MERRRQLLWAAAAVAAVLAAFSAAAEGGFRRYLKLASDVRGLKDRNAMLAQKNAQLAREIEAMRDDSQALERAAREELGFVRPGELVFILEPK